ncbi:MAG: hypothetical protein ACJ0BT_04430, partial [Pseudohongiellaceae bacterium]
LNFVRHNDMKMNSYFSFGLTFFAIAGLGLLASCSDSQNNERFAALPDYKLTLVNQRLLILIKSNN